MLVFRGYIYIISGKHISVYRIDSHHNPIPYTKLSQKIEKHLPTTLKRVGAPLIVEESQWNEARISSFHPPNQMKLQCWCRDSHFDCPNCFRVISISLLPPFLFFAASAEKHCPSGRSYFEDLTAKHTKSTRGAEGVAGGVLTVCPCWRKGGKIGKGVSVVMI